MQSNSKLTKDQKNYLKQAKKDGGNLKFVNDGHTTFAYQLQGKLVIFATSVMSDTETKFRRKVGEYYALDRLENGEYAMMRFIDFMCTLETFDIYI